MKKRIVFLLLAFFLTNTISVSYLGVLGNLTLEEVQNEVLEKDIEKSARGPGMWLTGEKGTRIDRIKYSNSNMDLISLDEHKMVDALKYYYPDGTTEIISEEDGRVLKERE